MVHSLVSLVIVGGVVAFIKLLLPSILNLFGIGGEIVMKAMNLLIVICLLLWVLYFLLDLLSCTNVGHSLR